MAGEIQGDTELVERILAEVLTAVSEPLPRSRVEQLRSCLLRSMCSGNRSGPQGERRSLTMLATELRGFDAIAEQHEPAAVIDLFNRYSACMRDVVARHGGLVDKMGGDSLSILFGAAEQQADHAARALACAAEMQQAMTRCNQQNEVLQLPPLYMGIGIHSGDVVVGAIGNGLHRDLTVLGGAIAIAARIARQSQRGQVFLSDSTYRLVRDFILVGELNTLRVRNRSQPLTIYELLGTLRPRALTVPRREIRKCPRTAVQMPCYFQRVKGSNALGAMHYGQIIDLGYNGLRLISPVPLEASSEIMMSLSLQLLGSRTSDIYARIVTADTEQQGYRCCVEFTGIDVVGRQAIKQFVDNQVGAF